MKKKFKNRYVRVFSRHPSHDSLRKSILVPELAVVRFGSTTEWAKSDYFVNSEESIKNSSSKIKMKECFNAFNVATAKWWKTIDDLDNTPTEEISFPLIAKRVFGSRGKGMVKIDSPEGLEAFVEETKNITSYIFEEFHNYTREYRLHVTENGCFYTCRKMLKADTPDDQKWFRNDSNCVWYLEDNADFDRPVNWDSIVAESVKALKSVGLDVGACDVRVQGAKKQNGGLRDNPKFIIVEINSAPSFGDVTLEKYKEEIPKILNRKYNI